MSYHAAFYDKIVAHPETKPIIPVIDSGRGPGLCPGVHFRREGSSLDAHLH